MQNAGALALSASLFAGRRTTFPTIRGNSPSTGFAGALAGYFSAGLVLVFFVVGVGFVFLALLVYAGLCSLVGGLLIFVGSWWLASRLGIDDRLSWSDSWTAAYWGYLLALVVDMTVSLATVGVDGMLSEAMVPVGPNPETIGEAFAPWLMRDFIGWLWPGIPVTTLVLAALHRMYRGTAGLPRGLLLTAVSLPGSLLFPLAILVGWSQRAHLIGGFGDVAGLVVGGGVLLALFAVGASGPGGMALMAAARRLRSPTDLDLQRAWWIAFRCLLVWGAVTGVVMFVLPFFDPFAEQIAELARSTEPLAYLAARPWFIPLALLTFGLLQAPGVWVAARVVRSRLRFPAPPLGPTARPALAAAAAVALAAWPVAFGLLWLLALSPWMR